MKHLCLTLIAAIAATSSLATDLSTLLPAHAPADPILHYTGFSLKYSEPFEQAEWVIYAVKADRLNGTVKRTNNFRSDRRIKTGSAALNDYRRSGFDRGHLAPAAVMKWSREAMSESFLMSNISPQRPGFNRGIWKNLEAQVRKWAKDNDELYVVSGPVLREGLPVIGPNEVAVPEFYFKVILDYAEPERKTLGFILPNQASRADLSSYAVSIDQVEATTGIDFFPRLPDDLEESLESQSNPGEWGQITRRQSKSKAASVTLPSAPTQANTDAAIVYVTATGKKYHVAGCRYLSASKTSIGVEAAKEKGYAACKVCKPRK